MKKAGRPPKGVGSGWRGRVLLALVSLTILALGSGTLVRGGLHYQNWWGGTMFAPFAIVIGGLGLFIAAFAPKAFAEKATRRSRTRGWPAGNARYYRHRD